MMKDKMKQTDMIAVILSGGQSSRMGQDKGLMQQEQGTSWIGRLQHQLAYLGMPVYVSVNPLQKTSYQSQIPVQKLVVDDVPEGLNGPLKGILSAHHAHRQHHILLVPCDMPLLDAPVFDLWLQHFDPYDTQYHTFVSKTPDGLQPLCGIYSRDGLQMLDTLYQQGKLLNQSMHAILENMLQSHMIGIPHALLPYFKNYNSPEDLKY